jgi:hypothetical protein
MKAAIRTFMFLVLAHSLVSSQQMYEVHSRGMLRQSVFNDGTLGRPADKGSTGAFQNMPSFEWPSNGGYPITINGVSYQGFYNSMGAGFWIAGDTSRYSGSGNTPRVWVQCGAVTDASGNNLPSDAIPISVQRIENYPVLSNGDLNPAYNPNEAEEIIVSKWDTPLGITVKRTSRAWSYPDYDDFIIYEYELENAGSYARTGRLDTISAITIAAAYGFHPSMIGGMLLNSNSWAELPYRGDKAGALSFNYARFNWTRYLMYNHTIDGTPFKLLDADTILTSPGAIGIQPLYYDYTHLANKNETIVALSSTSLPGDSISLYEMRNGDPNDKVLKQPYVIATDNGNLNIAKFVKFLDIERIRNNVPMRSSSDSATYGPYWLGRAKNNWTATLRNPTGHVYGFGPYTLAPHAKMKFVYAEVAGFGPGTSGDERYSDMGGGWGTGDHAPCDEPQPGVHPVSNWWNTILYPYLNPKGMDCSGSLLTQSPGMPDYTKIGSTYMQSRPLPDYVNSNVISIRDVADRAIQMYKGGLVVKYDDTSRYMPTGHDLSKQFDPSSNPLLPSPAQPTGAYQVPIPCPAPAITVYNMVLTGESSVTVNIDWGPQVETLTRSVANWSRLNAPLKYYLLLRTSGTGVLGPWEILDTVLRQDSRYLSGEFPRSFADGKYHFYDVTAINGREYFYSVVSVDSLGGKSGMTNMKYHMALGSGINTNEKNIPDEYALSQNYPNPFNPTTTINYQLPTKSKVQLQVFNLLGQCVATLVDAEQLAGIYEVPFHANTLSSGIYFYRITAGKFMKSQKMLLMR